MSLDTAVQRLQALSVQVSGIKAAPTYPPESADAMPISVAFIEQASGSVDDASTTREKYTIRVDHHVSREQLKNAYTRLNTYIPAYLRLLAGDPKLGGAVDTIIFPVTCEVTPLEWNNQQTLAAVFRVEVKIRSTPTAST